jgi:hypothetical protein
VVLVAESIPFTVTRNHVPAHCLVETYLNTQREMCEISLPSLPSLINFNREASLIPIL